MKGKSPDFAVLGSLFHKRPFTKGRQEPSQGLLRPKIGPHLAAGNTTVGFTPVPNARRHDTADTIDKTYGAGRVVVSVLSIVSGLGGHDRTLISHPAAMPVPS